MVLTSVDMESFNAWMTQVSLGIVSAEEAVESYMAGESPEEEVVAPSPPESGFALVMWYADKIGRKVETADIENCGALGTQLYDAAGEWLQSVNLDEIAWSEWATKLATKYRRGGSLSSGEAKGVLNIAVAAERRKSDRSCGLGAASVMNQPTPVAVAPRPRVDEDDAAYDAWCESVAATVTKGFFTLILDDGSHRTFKVGKWNRDNRSTNPDAKVRWIGLLTGPSNTSDYETVGFQRDNGDVVMIRQYRQSGAVKDMVSTILCGTKADRDGMRKAYAVESGTCAICNRVLTDPSSIIDRNGIGPECYKKGWM